MERILAATIAVSVDDGPHRAVFDKRALPRSLNAVWRSSVRLNRGFHAGLLESAIPLDRAAVETLRDTPMALDAYAWAKQALQGREPGEVASATWADLHAGFATASQDLSTFKPLFEAALQRAAEADPALQLQATSAEVCVAFAMTDGGGRSGTQPAPEVLPVTPVSEVTAPAVAQPTVTSTPSGPEPAELAAEQQGKPEGDPRGGPVQDDHAACVAERETIATSPIMSAPLPETVSLRSELTGLRQVIWLRRGYGVDSALVGVTPGARFDADRVTLLAVEPLVMQVSGGLPKGDFDQISAWITLNRDLIDDIWAGQVRSFEEISRRVRKAPSSAWR